MPLIGPSSLLLALMASGLNGQRFAFQGYLPAKEAERARTLRELELESRKRGQTQLFIETPYRNRQLFDSILQTCQSMEKGNAARNRAASDGLSAPCLSLLSAGWLTERSRKTPSTGC